MFQIGSVYDVIREIADIVKLNIGSKDLKLKCSLNEFKGLAMKFD